MNALKLPLLLAAASLAVAASANAADVIKANNADALNLTTSWSGGVAPTSADVAVWDSTVTAANTTAYGADASWAGIRISNPAGLVTLGNTADTTALTLGASGIDMSGATQNVLINGNLVAGAAQTWSVAAGRTLQIETINTNRTLTGSGDISLVNSTGSGTAIFDFRPGASGSIAFTAQAGFSGYTGNWTIGSGVTVKTLRNGINAWGTGTITLAGGTVGSSQNFNGTWTNNITLQSATTSFIDDFNSSGTRSLKLNGVISGSGNLTFSETNAGVTMTADTCFTLGGTNTMSGTVTVASGTFLRVGSIGGNDSTNTGGTFASGTTGDLGTAAVVNNGTLSFTRSNAIVVANTISGSGVVNIGSASANVVTTAQIVTLSGANDYSGATVISNGTLRLGNNAALGTGTLTVNNSSVISSDSTTARTLTNAVSIATTAAVTFGDATNNGALTFGTAALGVAGGVRSITTASDVTFSGALTGTSVGAFTKAGSGTLTLAATGTAAFNSTIAINAGTVMANASNALGAAAGTGFTVASGATLGGSGSVFQSATINGNITGGTAAAVGTLGTGALTLGATGVYLAQINSGLLTADKLTVTGALTLNATSTLTLSDLGLASLNSGELLTIASYTGGVTGTFANAANGSTLTVGNTVWQINYGASDITLTAVPEPSTYGLIGAGALAAVAFVRRRRKAAGLAA